VETGEQLEIDIKMRPKYHVSRHTDEKIIIIITGRFNVA